jgi:cyclopropane fatty-acyl-phospholipid synthase-like methyltransferase
MNNDEFFYSLTVEELEHFSEMTFGIPPSDLQEFLKYLNKNGRILEVGTGIGRIGIELIKKGCNYTGVEKQEKFLREFKSRLKNIKFNPENVELINSSFEELEDDKKYDTIIFSFTVIGDFSKKEQIIVLKKTYDLLNPEGIGLIDNPSKNQAYNRLRTYNPTKFYYDNWKEELDEIGFLSEVEIYKTKTGRERELIILKKKQ